MRWTDIILGLFAAAGPLLASVGGLLFYRQNKIKKNLDISQQQVGIEIDETTRNKLVQEAATINQEREQKREEWWGEQIQMLRSEIESERKLSNRRYRRLNQIEEWAMLHLAWDRRAWAQLRETHPDFGEPPWLPDELPENV